MDSLNVFNELIILQSWNVDGFFNHFFGLHLLIICQSVDVYLNYKELEVLKRYSSVYAICDGPTRVASSEPLWTLLRIPYDGP